jgi:hypothetical protein
LLDLARKTGLKSSHPDRKYSIESVGRGAQAVESGRGKVQSGTLKIMRKLLFELVWACGALFWGFVCWRSRSLSVRYNAWTTQMRFRFGRDGARPTPRMLEVNTRIMAWIIRIAGAWFALLSVLALVMAQMGK